MDLLLAGVLVGFAMTPHLFIGVHLWLLLALLAWGAVYLSERSWLVVGLMLGLFIGQSTWEAPRFEGYVQLRGEVCSSSAGRVATLCLHHWTRIDEEWRDERARVRLKFREEAPGVGTDLAISGWASSRARTSLPGSPDESRLAWRDGVRSFVRVDEWELLGEAELAAPPDVRTTGLLKALSTGNRDELTEEQLVLFRRTGTAHLLAVSGMHIGMIGLAVTAVVMALFRAIAVIYPLGVNPWPAYVTGALAALTYAQQVGWSVSALRAAIMFSLTSLLMVVGRSPTPLRLLLLAAVAVVVMSPGVLGQVSFQLSFGAMLGLIKVYPWLNSYCSTVSFALCRWGLRSVSASVSATIGTLPAVAWWFQDLAVWGPVANLVAVPVVSIVLVPAALWLQFGPSGEWVWVGGLADLTERALMIFLASMPVHMWHPAVTNWGAAGLCLALFGCRQLAFVFLLIWLSFGLQRTSTVVALEILDVGQGSSALLHLPGQDPVLIDGGPPGRQVVSYLRRRGHTRLSLVVASHGDLDHVGGLIPVLEDLQVDELWVGGRSAAPALNGLALARHIPVRDCAQALTRSVAFELWCDPDPATENDGSLVIRHAGAVILGDLSAEGEAAYLRASPVPAEVVVLAHHGSRHSSAAETFEILQPKLAIVSAGRHNSYGHPHPSVIQRLNKRNTPVLSTANSGSITLSFGSTTTLRMHQPGLGWSSWLSLDELQRDGLRIETQQRPTWRESWRRLVNN